MEHIAEPGIDELLWTIAVARLILGSGMNIQAPPNLTPGVLGKLIAAGINDFGGVSSVTPDFINPEAPWPELEKLRDETAAAGKELAERLAIYPEYALEANRWLDSKIAISVRRSIDSDGLARTDRWFSGDLIDPPTPIVNLHQKPSSDIAEILRRTKDGAAVNEQEIVRLFCAR